MVYNIKQEVRMTVKDTVLKTLEENRNKYISGEELASELGVS